jgi:uncharacterized Zn finger protein
VIDIIERFEKRSFLFKFKEIKNFNLRNTLKYFENSAITLHSVQNLSLTQELGKKERYAKVSTGEQAGQMSDKDK